MYNFGEIEDVAYFMRRMYERGLTTTLGGNISRRSDYDSIFISPSQVDKGRLSAWQIGSVTSNGTVETKDFTPSRELNIHLGIYKSRPDVHAIIRSHPIYATTFSATNKLINHKIIAEYRFKLGNIVRTPYSKSGSEELASNVAKAAKNSNVILIENHGVITLGSSLEVAFERLEVLENSARITLMTSMLNDTRELSEGHIDEIDNMFEV